MTPLESPQDRETRLRNIRERVEALPLSPGCYLMRSRDGTIFYIGKATRLKERVRSYFSGSDTRAFVQRLDDLLADIEYLETSTPHDALILERSLIQQHKPKFNVRLKDDSNYIHLRLAKANTNATRKRDVYPRLEVVRRPKSDGALYFGPFPNARALRRTLEFANRTFLLRTCRDHVLENRTRPCLQAQIGRCAAPCVRDIDDYADQVRDLTMFLRRESKPLLEKLTQDMWQAANEERYERAAKLRDQIEALQSLFRDKRTLDVHGTQHADVFGFARNAGRVHVVILSMRSGTVVHTEHVSIEDSPLPKTRLLSMVVESWCKANSDDAPQWVLLPFELSQEDQRFIKSEHSRSQKLKFKVPKRGPQKRILDLAHRNAVLALQQNEAKQNEREQTLQELQELLHLDRVPRRIECYDISTFQGRDTKASQVVFVEGIPAKNDYRSYTISTHNAGDDFSSLKEVLRRRIQRALKEDSFPDLFLIDGGRPQMRAVLTIFEEQRIEMSAVGTHVIGIAKARKHLGTDERLVSLNPDCTYPLKQRSKVRYLIERIRDEAHRFAIHQHRRARAKSSQKSLLDSIQGLGPAKRKALLKHFGSLASIQNANRETLETCPGIGPRLAKEIHDSLHPKAC